jgi:hypothetical protein
MTPDRERLLDKMSEQEYLSNVLNPFRNIMGTEFSEKDRTGWDLQLLKNENTPARPVDPKVVRIEKVVSWARTWKTWPEGGKGITSELVASRAVFDALDRNPTITDFDLAKVACAAATINLLVRTVEDVGDD